MSDSQNVTAAVRYATRDLKYELATARRMMERAPAERYDWRPHEKSFSLGQLVAHISNLVHWGIVNMREDSYDLDAPRPGSGLPEGPEALLEVFDQRVEVLTGILENATEAMLEEPWTLRKGEAEIFTDTKGKVLRRWCTSHIIHHRGQLSVYLRLLDVPVPPSYGPTADEGW